MNLHDGVGFSNSMHCAVVDDFFSQLVRYAQNLPGLAKDYGEVYPIPDLVTSLENMPRKEHYAICCEDSGWYSSLADELLVLAQMLTEDIASVGELRLTEDWIITAPQRLMNMHREIRRGISSDR